MNNQHLHIFCLIFLVIVVWGEKRSIVHRPTQIAQESGRQSADLPRLGKTVTRWGNFIKFRDKFRKITLLVEMWFTLMGKFMPFTLETLFSLENIIISKKFNSDY